MNEPLEPNKSPFDIKKLKSAGAMGAFAAVVLLASLWMVVAPSFVSEEGGSFFKRRGKVKLADEFRRQREEEQRGARGPAAPDAPAAQAYQSGMSVTGGRALAEQIAAGSADNTPAWMKKTGGAGQAGVPGGQAGMGAAGAPMDGAAGAAGGAAGAGAGLTGGGALNGGGAAGAAGRGAAPRAGTAGQTGDGPGGAPVPKLDLSRTLTAFSQSSGRAILGQSGSSSGGASTNARFTMGGPTSAGGGFSGGAAHGGGGSASSLGGGSSVAPDGRGTSGKSGGGSAPGVGKAQDTSEYDKMAEQCKNNNSGAEKQAQDRLGAASKALADAECKPKCNYAQDDWCKKECPGAGISCWVCRCIQLGCEWRRRCEEAERIRCDSMKSCPLTANQSCSMDCVR